MQVEAVYENGVIKTKHPLQLKQKVVEVVLIVPDEAIEKPQKEISPLRKEINDIMGRFAQKRPYVSPEEDKAAWHEHLEEKYLR